MLSHIRFILVQPSHPGNIGAVARAMKNMGLTNLGLVAPSLFPHPDASARAAGADDVLANAQVFASVNAAIADSVFAVATSARTRRLPWPVMTPRAAAQQVLAQAVRGRVAVVFGAERSGLSNEDLERCHAAVVIPSNPNFSSLNLAAAVQIMAYEIWTQASDAPVAVAPVIEADDPWAIQEQMEGLYNHLSAALQHIGFFDTGNPDVVLRRLRRLFSRTQLTVRELNILRGACKAILTLRRG